MIKFDNDVWRPPEEHFGKKKEPKPLSVLDQLLLKASDKYAGTYRHTLDIVVTAMDERLSMETRTAAAEALMCKGPETLERLRVLRNVFAAIANANSDGVR